MKRYIAFLLLVISAVCFTASVAQISIDGRYGQIHYPGGSCSNVIDLDCGTYDSPDCTLGDGTILPDGCVTGGEAGVCLPNRPLVGVYVCVHKGYECEGDCRRQGGVCFGAHFTHCSSTYWWPWEPTGDTSLPIDGTGL